MLKFLFSFTILFYYHNLVANEKDRALKYLDSFEYRMLTIEIYKSAEVNFKNINLKNSNSCLIEQNSTNNLPLAVITDIDETILLNYEFEYMLHREKKKFSYKLFNKYVTNKSCTPIKGAISYFNFLYRHGVKIIYISNREYKTEDKTFEHLKELGFPIDTKDDLLLLHEKKDWVKDKSIRRKYIAKHYKVIQMFGDNLNDFANDKKLIKKYQDRFGKCWFLLPNPFYGTWLY